MTLRRTFLSISLLAATVTPAALGAVVKADPTPAEIETIIQKFAAKESEFAKARANYTYRQTTKLIEYEPGGEPGGKYELVFDVTFSDNGKRLEHVVRAPVSTLERIIMTPEDEADMRNVMPFVLTTEDVDQYYVRYLSRQKIDEIDCYMFSVKPKQLDKSGKRYFEGEIWVDDQDLQIVKSYGKSIGYLKRKGQQFPKFETYRQQIDGKYWFPTYTYADDVLNFDNGPQRIKQIIKYEDYKQFKSESIIKYNDPSATPPSNEPKGPPKPNQ